MSEKNFHLEIVTPLALKFEGEVTMVRLPGVEGEMGILAGHAPLLALLEPGVSEYRAKDLDFPLASGAGFVKVAENRVVVMVDSAERPEEIDAASAQAERESIDRELAGHGGADQDDLRERRALAVAREKVAART